MHEGVAAAPIRGSAPGLLCAAMLVLLAPSVAAGSDGDAGARSSHERDAVEASSANASVSPERRVRRASKRRIVYWEPVPAKPRKGWIAAGTRFEIVGKVEGRACEAPWGMLASGGYVCLDHTKPTKKPPTVRAAPRKLGLLPFLYGKRSDNPAFSYAFERFIEGETGKLSLVRPSGRRFDGSRYQPHHPSRFRGRDVVEEPIPDGMVAAWTFIDDAPVYAVPDDEAEPLGALPKHTPLMVEAEPVDEDGRWFRIPDGLGPGRPGFVDDLTAIRRWSPDPAPDDIGDDEIWIDIVLDQQMLAVRRGDELVYVTLISSGIPTRATPTGRYSIRDKRAWSSMGSRPDADDPYFVEHVPWTMYFRDHYAIHGAYWHDVFGTPRSHGCVNLSPADAAYVYSVVAPEHDDSFHWTYASERAPGSPVRIRSE